MIAGARKIVALTGAGISAESGIPTFRGEGGLWGRFDPYVVASIDSFRRNPAPYWEFFKEVRTPALKSARPNKAHKALALLEEKKRLSSVITQNIDGLHQAAGSTGVLELHGSMTTARCEACQHRRPMTSSHVESVPACPACGRRMRPDVVWFGEALPMDV
jgi:NAD-dependent deacetylase